MKRLTFFLFLFCASKFFSITYISAADGLWETSFTWQGGVAPSYNCSDTVIVNTDVEFTANLDVSGYLKINSGGLLCGHYKLQFNIGKFENYGTMKVDTLNLNQSNGWNYAGGNIIVKFSAKIYSMGSSFHSSGGAMSVGPDFTCDKPKIGIEEYLENEFRIYVYPSPANRDKLITFQFSTSLDNAKLVVYDVRGKVVGKFYFYSDEISIEGHLFSTGIYYYTVCAENVFSSGKFVVVE
jgi:hypothetical protein